MSTLRTWCEQHNYISYHGIIEEEVSIIHWIWNYQNDELLSMKIQKPVTENHSPHNYETVDSWWPSFPSCRCTRLEQSTTQCHFSALSVYFQKETQNRSFFPPFFCLDCLQAYVCIFYMPLVYVYFLSKRLCCPPHRACIVPLQLNLAYVTLICSLTN